MTHLGHDVNEVQVEGEIDDLSQDGTLGIDANDAVTYWIDRRL